MNVNSWNQPALLPKQFLPDLMTSQKAFTIQSTDDKLALASIKQSNSSQRYFYYFIIFVILFYFYYF